MLTVNTSTNIDPASPLAAEWDVFAGMNACSGFMQSIAWAQFKRRQGLDNILITVRMSDTIIGGALCYYPAKARGSSLLVAPEGPVLPWSNPTLAEAVLEAILKECERLSFSLGVFAVRMEPRIPASESALLSSMSRAPTDLIPRETLYIDLQKDEQAILASMKSKGRYNIGLAAKRGIKVIERSTVASARQFYGIMQESSQRDKYSLEPYPFFESLLETLAPHTARLFFAEHDNDVLGTLLMVSFGRRATYLYGGINNSKRNKMAGYALQWTAMCEARKAGCTVYDFYGFDQFQAPGNLYATFSQFKSKFGGVPIRFAGGHDYYFLDKLADTVIAALREVDVDAPAADELVHDNPLQLQNGFAASAYNSRRGE